MFDLLSSLILGDKGTSDQTIDNPYQVSGTFEFYLEPCVQGFLGLHTATLVMSVYADETKQQPLDFSVKWSKIMNSETFEMENYHEPYYHCTPSDIDLRIRAAVTCNDPKHPGVAYFYCGPIQMDKAIIPEVEGLILNQCSSNKIQILSVDGVALPHNISRVNVKRPNVTFVFDPDLEDWNTNELDTKKAFLPLELNFDSEAKLKVRTETSSVTSINLVYTEGQDIEKRLKFKFDSRFERDTFYIFLRLIRSIKAQFLEKLISQYEQLITMQWCFINMNKDEEEDEMPGEYGYEMMIRFDLVREQLRKMVKINREFNDENSIMVDTLDVLERDLNKAITNFRSLIKLSKRVDERALNQLEAENRSVMQEASIILEDIKKSKKKKDLDSSVFQQEDDKRDIERKLEKIKQTNIALKKEIDSYKVEDQFKKKLDKIDISGVPVGLKLLIRSGIANTHLA